jgi:hypothetical protein
MQGQDKSTGRRTTRKAGKMATATMARQARGRRTEHKVKTFSVPASGKLERQQLEDGEWKVFGWHYYYSADERTKLFGMDDDWCKATPNSRVVDHCTEQGKPRHKIVAEWKMDTPASDLASGDFYPYHYQGVDYEPPSLQ